MKYFAAILPIKDSEKNRLLRPQHLEFLAGAEQEGKIFARGRFADGTGGLVIYIADSIEEARRIAEGDPYVQSGARGLELHEWEMVPRG